MGTLERIYDKMPIFLQNGMVSAKGILNNRSRYGRAYWEHRAFLKRFDTLPLKERLEYQKEELLRFLCFAQENSAYYKELFQNVDLNGVQSVGDLKQLPVLEKETLRSRMDDVMTKTKEPTHFVGTGGTTGKSLVVAMTDADMMRRMAMLDHFKARVGFEHRKMRRATFNGKHIVPPGQKSKCFWRYNAACKQMIYSSFHITEENLEFYVKSLNRFKPHAIDGFFTSMCDVANYIQRHNIPLEFKPVAIFPTSETLTQSGRELLEQVFGCKVYDQYASSEGAPFVTECTEQTLHIELSQGVIERLDDSNEILVTSFTTHGTPLIRYRIGDRMDFAGEEHCPCGDPSPIIHSIEGRRLDFLYTAEGAKINAGNVSNILKYFTNVIVRAQFIQEKKDEVLLLLEVDRKRYVSENDELIEKEFLHKFGPHTKLTVQHVSRIPREASGKFRMIKNNVKE